jgi:hypothetical protein
MRLYLYYVKEDEKTKRLREGLSRDFHVVDQPCLPGAVNLFSFPFARDEDGRAYVETSLEEIATSRKIEGENRRGQ